MKNVWVVILLVSTGCSSARRDGDDPGNHGNDVRNLTAGEVRQLAFTGDGKNLVVVNEFRFFNANREKCHGRLRRFSSSDWKLFADTGEMDVTDLAIAPCVGSTWTFQAKPINRRGKGNPYTKGPIFYTVSPLTLERKEFDPIQQGLDNVGFSPVAISCTGERPLCGLYVLGYITPPAKVRPLSVFLFDVKAGKKTVELQDRPTGERAPGEDYIVQPVLEFAPNGKHLVSFEPSAPYQMQMHDADTGKLLKSIKLKSAVGAIRFSPNGKLLAAVCQDGTLLILHADLSGQIFSKQVERFTFEKYGGFPRAVAFVGDGHLAVMSSDTNMELLDTMEWKSIRTFEEKSNRINCLAGSPDGKLLAMGGGQTASLPGFVRVFEVKTGKLVAELE